MSSTKEGVARITSSKGGISANGQREPPEHGGRASKRNHVSQDAVDAIPRPKAGHATAQREHGCICADASTGSSDAFWHACTRARRSVYAFEHGRRRTISCRHSAGSITRNISSPCGASSIASTTINVCATAAAKPLPSRCTCRRLNTNTYRATALLLAQSFTVRLSGQLLDCWLNIYDQPPHQTRTST